MEWFSAAFGLALLVFAGDMLVKGAVNLSLRLGVPALIVSLTIVAFGTSAPELLVSVQAVLEHSPGLALGNVVGSNVANILLVLGLPALISRLHTAATDTRRSYTIMIAATLVFIGAAFLGAFTWPVGIAFLIILASILYDQGRAALRHRSLQDNEVEGLDPKMPAWKIAVFIAAGVAGLPLGADILVEAAQEIARDFGVSDSVIGLTLVAVGTSMPELATTVVAAIRRQADVALGNVIGSNIFNLLGIIGVASLFGAIPVESSFLHMDLWVMLGASLLIAPFVFSGQRDMTRRYGFPLVVLYVAYVSMVVLYV